MELFRIIKSDARRAMRSFIGRAVASVMITTLAYLAVNLTESVLLFIFSGEESLFYDFYSLADTSPEVLAITAGAAVIWLFVMPALLLGHAKLNLAFAEGKDESISLLFDMFSSFKKFIGSAVFALCLGLRFILTFAAALVPGGVLFYLAEAFLHPASRTAEILKISACCIAIGLMTLCVALWVMFVQRWYLAPYYRACGNTVHKSFALSVKATKGIRTNIISFKFSFIGWGLISFFILPLLWSVPYYALSNAIYSKYLMERYERSLAEVPENIEPEEPELTPDP